MLCTVNTQIPYHAPVDSFVIVRNPLLTGRRLNDVKTLADSIERFGLMTPIVAIARGDQLIVVDGRKRIAALRRLAFEGRLPRSLATIPYSLSNEVCGSERPTPVILSNRDLFRSILRDFRCGVSVSHLSRTHRLSRQCVHDILSLSRLSPVLQAAFFKRLIDFSQARAYATIPDMDEQLARLKRLGPFASPDDILGDDRDASPDEESRDIRIAA